ncbi:hypothetical protein [Fibrisoma montanum]|uniref:hypothetical protein n=1 Tax=Fibrisoma montanum TaxID=2305895 RepID=UPI001E4DB5CD|nr:hypothetical protein [Fibrisoma montanum]
MITRFCLICTFLCVTCSSRAQSSGYQSGLTTADSLLTANQYFEAGIAYERVLFENTDTASTYKALLGKVVSLKKLGRYGAAVTFINSQYLNGYPDSVRYQLRYQQILCSYLAGQFENTRSLLEQLPVEHSDAPYSPLLGCIRVLTLNELHRWPEAAIAYREALARSGADTTLTDPYRRLPKLKRETKAQWLSTFLPGAGQLYAGKPGEAILSILVQSAGLYFGVTSFLNAYYLSAWGVGAALFGSFHAGGIRRSQELVRQYNQRQISAFNQRVKTQLLQQSSPDSASSK